MESNNQFIKRPNEYIKKINNGAIIKYNLNKKSKDKLDYNTDMLEPIDYSKKIGHIEEISKETEISHK